MLRGKTVLLTGGTGFIGHHSLEHYVKVYGMNVVVLDSLNYAGTLARLTDIELFREWQVTQKVRIVPHNIRFPFNEYVDQLIGHVDYVVHMAAETHVDRSIENPLPFVQTNIEGTYNVLEFARSRLEKGLERYIQVSTDEVYGPSALGQEFKETDRVRPSNPYAATKEAGDSLAYAWWNTYGLPVMITRTMNNFGERQHPEKYVMKVIRALMNGDTLTVHGAPDAIGSRYWLHARNHADATAFLLQEGKPGEFYHVVGEELNNLEMAQLIANVVGIPLKYKFLDFHQCRPGHDRRYALDGSKIHDAGWTPPHSTRVSLENTIRWMLKRQEWLLPEAYSTL